MDNIFATAAKNARGHWYKGDYTDGKGNYCAAGHVIAVKNANEGLEEFEDNLALEETNVLNALAHEMSNGLFHYIADFNDDGDTTEDDVVTLLEKAAVRWDERI